MILQGDCLEVLKTLDSESIQCCVTSPPYYGLRNYGTAKWDGGDPNCDHKIPESEIDAKNNHQGASSHQIRFNREKCWKCGAVRIDDQIGLEESPEEYVNKLVSVFQEVKRVLKDDGTLWLNLGDSYNGSGGAGGDYNNGGLKEGQPKYPGRNIDNLKPKDLIGIPWMVAFALRADGWYLRSDIIWHKPNPMPESVKDRPTKSHEYIFLLSKSAKYFYDYEAIQEEQKSSSLQRLKRGWNGNGERGYPNGPQNHLKNYMGKTDEEIDQLGGRNKRDVWTVNTKPFKEAHFAVFPPKLIEPCILAGSAENDKVLDPFCGSGTTGVVCAKYGREFVGIELNPEYVEMAEKRIWNVKQQMRLF